MRNISDHVACFPAVHGTHLSQALPASTEYVLAERWMSARRW